MPIGRILLKSISESKKLSLLKTDGARLLYTWLIPHVDVNGCFSGDPEVIRGQVFTRLKKTNKDIEEYLGDLQENGLILRYQSNGDAYIFLPTFEEKQPRINRDREAAPRIPPPTPDQIRTSSGPNPEQIPLKLNEIKVKLKEKDDSLDSEFSDFWEAYPIKEGKADALKAFRALRKTTPLETIAQAFNGYMDFLKHERVKNNFERRPKLAATFLRSDRWKEFIDFKYKAPL